MTGPGAADEGADFVATRLLAVVREDVARADAKASALLSFVVALSALLVSGGRVPDGASAAGRVLLGLGGLAWLAGTALLVRSVLPRSRTERTGPGITFYADVLTVHQESGVPGVLAAARAAGGNPAVWLITQTVDLSRILAQKYRCIRWGVCWLFAGVVCVAAGLLAG